MYMSCSAAWESGAAPVIRTNQPWPGSVKLALAVAFGSVDLSSGTTLLRSSGAMGRDSPVEMVVVAR